MSIEEHRYNEAGPAFEFLDRLALGDVYIFRGHAREQYRLVTTMERHQAGCVSHVLDDLIDRFRVGLTRLGITPFESDRRLDWLECARHHGVPTPVLDFTYSPYVALFFAFNGSNAATREEQEFTVTYAINPEKLAVAWATLKCSPENDREAVEKRRREFLYPRKDLFDAGFPMRNLQFIPHPGRFSHRMHRQQGALLFDTLQYAYLPIGDLDDLLETCDESSEPESLSKAIRHSRSPIAHKIYIRAGCAHDVFQKLELMGISGGTLFMNADGVAFDVANSMSFHSRVAYLRDLRFPRSEL